MNSTTYSEKYFSVLTYFTDKKKPKSRRKKNKYICEVWDHLAKFWIILNKITKYANLALYQLTVICSIFLWPWIFQTRIYWIFSRKEMYKWLCSLVGCIKYNSFHVKMQFFSFMINSSYILCSMCTNNALLRKYAQSINGILKLCSVLFSFGRISHEQNI